MMETEAGGHGQTWGCWHHQRLEQTGRVLLQVFWAAWHWDALISDCWHPERVVALFGAAWCVGLG